MLGFISIPYVNNSSLQLYYYIVSVVFLYTLYKYRKDIFSIYILLFFFEGLIAELGKSVLDLYRVAMVLATTYFFVQYKVLTIRRYYWVFISFLAFTICFFFSSIINGDYFTIIFSQYSRYYILFCAFCIFFRYRNSEATKIKLERLFYYLLSIQVYLSVIKYFTIGVNESVVGSIGAQGGAMATSLPILGFIFYWLYKKGKLAQKDWIFIIGLLFIGFVNIKRAIWFVAPVIIAAVVYFVPKKIHYRVIFLAMFFVPFVFYLGVRLNYTLNREHKVWGTFDINYVIDYAQEYTYGGENAQKGVGRIGATVLLGERMMSGGVSADDWFGIGLRFVYSTSYEDFKRLGTGINSKGSATGIFQTYLAMGFIGVFCTLFFIFALVLNTRNVRLRYVLLSFLLFEYLFYTGTIIRSVSLSFLLIFMVLFSQKELES